MNSTGNLIMNVRGEKSNVFSALNALKVEIN